MTLDRLITNVAGDLLFTAIMVYTMVQVRRRFRDALGDRDPDSLWAYVPHLGLVSGRTLVLFFDVVLMGAVGFGVWLVLHDVLFWMGKQ